MNFILSDQCRILKKGNIIGTLSRIVFDFIRCHLPEIASKLSLIGVLVVALNCLRHLKQYFLQNVISVRRTHAITTNCVANHRGVGFDKLSPTLSIGQVTQI